MAWYSAHLIFRIIFVLLLFLFLLLILRAVRKEMVQHVPAGDQIKRFRPGYLRVTSADNTAMPFGTTFALDPQTTIGRGDDNTLIIDDATVSSSHAKFLYDGVNWHLRDMSSYGTLINGTKLHKAESPLNTHDKITIGSVTFELIEGAQA